MRHSQMFKFVVLLCLLAVPLVMSAEASHFHKDAPNSCPICVIAHAAAPALLAGIHFVAGPLFSNAHAAATKDQSFYAQLLAFELSVRPPPAL